MVFSAVGWHRAAGGASGECLEAFLVVLTVMGSFASLRMTRPRDEALVAKVAKNVAQRSQRRTKFWLERVGASALLRVFGSFASLRMTKESGWAAVRTWSLLVELLGTLVRGAGGGSYAGVVFFQDERQEEHDCGGDAEDPVGVDVGESGGLRLKGGVDSCEGLDMGVVRT